jgi:predicted glutamine amidotransferase
MCRWIAYSGAPIPLDELVVNTEISLIDQSLSARQSEEPTNGDGFGIGWYGPGLIPRRYRSTQPAWNDANLRDLTAQVASHLFLAHVRRSTGTAVQQSNCHPFQIGKWLFVHNGLIDRFSEIKRDLVFAVDPELFHHIGGTTDSEVMFLLALSLGLDDEPLPALERMAGLIEQLGRSRGIACPVQMSLGLTDGQQLLAVRYSSAGSSRSLYHSNSPAAIRDLYPDHPQLARFSDDARAVVSEPLHSLSGIWNEVPESTAIEVAGGNVRQVPFQPQPV